MEIIRIQSYSSGEFTLNGSPVTIADMRTAMDAVSDRDTVVWYYREAPGTEPTEQQMEALTVIVDAGLPISLSTKADFSDYVGADGNSHPRGALE